MQLKKVGNEKVIFYHVIISRCHFQNDKVVEDLNI